MRIISTGTLKAYFEKHPETETGIKVWIKKVKEAKWNQPSDILKSFTHARTIGNGRVVFNINKNDYRLIVMVNYNRESVFVVFIGTHSEYESIDPHSVWRY